MMRKSGVLGHRRKTEKTHSESVWESVSWLSGKLDPTLFYNN